MNLEMMEQLKKECPRMATFFNKNSKLAEQHIFQGFLENDEYRDIFIQAICFPTNDTILALDEAFKNHYANVQFTQYLSKTLYWTSVRYDQNRRGYRDNQPLVMDNLYEADTIGYSYKEINDFIADKSDLGTWSEDLNLTSALLQLTDKQQTVIIERYGYERTNNEIAYLLNVSPQAISKTHLLALKRLRCMLEKDVNE